MTFGPSGTPSIQEPTGTSVNDNMGPDGLTLIPWERGKRLVWDVTCADTLALSYIADTVRNAGAAAEDDKEKKIRNLQFFQRSIHFLPHWCGNAWSMGAMDETLFSQKAGV